VVVKQLEGWAGVPSWGPEILARFALAGAVDRLPGVYTTWDAWAARVAESHMKYPVLTHFRLPRAKNHWAIAVLAMMDAAALELVLRPDENHAEARLFLSQALNCGYAVTYAMRRVEPESSDPGIDEADFRKGVDRMSAAGYPMARSADEAWPEFAALRSSYSPLFYGLAYWTVAAPAPWSGTRAGFDDLAGWPEAPAQWSLG